MVPSRKKKPGPDGPGATIPEFVEPALQAGSVTARKKAQASTSFSASSREKS
jgi:hypothetical protein